MNPLLRRVVLASTLLGPVLGAPPALAAGWHPDGGVVAVWFDGREGNDDVYSQRLTSSGLPVPAAFGVLAAAPNPTSAASSILFQLAAPSRVHAKVYDATGQRVRTLAGGEEFSTGRQSLTWDDRRGDGGSARAGLYFVRLSACARVRRVKLVRIL